MATNEYEVDGKKKWSFYINKRSPSNPRIRLQKRVFGFESLEEALKAEKKHLALLSREVGQLEAKGCTWDELIDKWQAFHMAFPSEKLSEVTIYTYAQILRKWTTGWMKMNPGNLTRGDARTVFFALENEGCPARYCSRVKMVIHKVFNWGVEERLIVGTQTSPVQGLELSVKKEEKLPEILTIEQIKRLLLEAKERRHPWQHVWAFTLLTGCRSGEANGLRKEDIQLIQPDEVDRQLKLPPEKRHFGTIRLQRAWKAREKKLGPLKSRQWRNVPVSSELYLLIRELMAKDYGSDAHGAYLLPRFWLWDNGEQAAVLRAFCKEIGIPSIRFHTLRACFATHLISRGVPSATVMKICGWKELKTMERYIRLAGIDERGATEGLGFIPSDQGVMENVVSMFDFRV